jgi:hypothetical protein
MVVGNWLGLRGCGVVGSENGFVDVGWGGTNERTPFFIRYERRWEVWFFPRPIYHRLAYT